MDSGRILMSEIWDILEISAKASDQTNQTNKAGIRLGFPQCDKYLRKTVRNSLKEGRWFLTFPSTVPFSIATVLWPGRTYWQWAHVTTRSTHFWKHRELTEAAEDNIYSSK